MANIFKKVFGKGGAIDKATRWADKKTGGITGKLLKGVEGIVKGIPVVGGVYGAAKGVGGAMLKIASGEAKRENQEKQEVAAALKSPEAKTASMNYEVTVTNKANFFTKIKNWFLGLPMWVRVVMMAVPFLLFMVFIIIRRKRPTRRRSVRRSTPARAARRRTATRSKSKSAFVKRMQAGKRKAARKRKRG